METLNVFYRICPHNSAKSPVYKDNKSALAGFCLQSFIKAFEGYPVEVHFIADSCPPDYIEALNRVPLVKHIHEYLSLGNKGSFFKQVEMACELDDNALVYLVEDDYYHLGESIGMFNAIKAFDFVTPYDHGGHYEQPWVDMPQKLKILDNHHFRTSVSTCLTFGCRAKNLKDNRGLVHEYGINDHGLWLEILNKGYELWCPIPTFATHMAEGLISYGVEWPW